MSNLVYYLCLAALGIGTSVYTIYTKRNLYKPSTLFGFYVCVTGLTWICEFMVLGLLNSYTYKTGVIKDIWAENLLGHLILNTTLYPAAAVTQVCTAKKRSWILFVAVLFTSIEYLFVRLNLYVQHWWRYYMTFTAVVVLLVIQQKWFNKLIKRPYGITRAITFYFGALMLIHTPAPILLLLRKQYYKLGLVNNAIGNLYLSSIIIVFTYHLVEAFIMIICTCILKKFYWKIVPIIISITVQYIFLKTGILVIEDGWNIIYTLIFYEAFLVSFMLIEKFTIRP